MEEKPPLQLPTTLLNYCKLIICDEISSAGGKLHTFLSNTLKFKILEVDPLVIEKDCPSLDDIYKLLDALNNLQHSHNRKDVFKNPPKATEIEMKPSASRNHKQKQTNDTRKRDNNCTIIADDNHDILNQEQLSKHQDFASINMQIPTLKNGGNERKILKGDLGASEILPSTDSSDSDAESQDTIMYSIEVSSLDGIKMYFKGVCNDKYFDHVKSDGTCFTFILTVCEEDISFLNKLKQIKVEECKFDPQDEIYFKSAVKGIQSQKREMIAYIKDNKVQIVGLKDSVTSAKKKLLDIVTNYKRAESLDKKSPFIVRNEEKSEISDDKTYKLGESKKLEDNEMSLSPDFYSPSSSPPEDHYNKQKAIYSGDGGNKRQILKPGDLGASEILSNTDSSDSDAESQYKIIYSMQASSLDGIRVYFKGLCNDKYFDHVKSDGRSFLFKLRNTCEEDVTFLSKLKKIKVEECKFDPQDEIYFKSAVKDIQSQNREMIVYIKDNKVHIVGLKDSVTSAKKKLLDNVTNYKSTVTRTESLDKKSSATLRNPEKSRISDDYKTDKRGRSQKLDDNEIPMSHDVYITSSSLPEDRYIKQKADKTTYSGDNKQVIFSKVRGIFYAGNERILFKVQISKADITKLEVDCIVNAANKRLLHIGGVSRAISEAAGPALNKECEDFTLFDSRRVDVTDIFVSTGGKMPAKCVMHAVGPKWEDYEAQKKEQCFDDLRHTVVRCLVEADRRGFTSIALSSISAAIFKVPKEECARCYMEAVKHFGLFTKQTSLRDIQFVDVDDTMVTIIEEQFQKNWTKSCDPQIVQKDCDFAKRHIYTGNRNVAKSIEKSHDTSKFTPSSSVSTKSPGASKAASDLGSRLHFGKTAAALSEMRIDRSSAYLIGKFTLCTDTRPAFNLPADITITVGKPFDKLSGLPDFSVSSNQKIKESEKNIYQMYEVSQPKLSQPKKLCALLPEPDDAETIKQSIGNLETIILSPNHKMIMETVTNVVLTSSILYSEPYNTQKKDKTHTWDRKKVGQFARCLFDCLQRASGVTALKVTLVGSEDALQIICKVIESRDVKKISLEPNSSSNHGAIGRSITRGDNSDSQQINPLQYARSPFVDDKQHGSKSGGSSVYSEKTCEICVDQKTNCPLKCCGKYLCRDCEKEMANCPFCHRFWRVLIGDQPSGTMAVRSLHDNGFWEIKYSFPSGVQKACHPRPGAPYTGIHRTAYLPKNNDGLNVLILLRVAFLRRLTFTVGRSLTTDRENTIIWNDIHHKTSLNGGLYGYPDPNYLYRVTQELANKGVTFDTMSADETSAISHFKSLIQTVGFFTDMF